MARGCHTIVDMSSTDSLMCNECEADYVCEECSSGWHEGSPVTRRDGETNKEFHYRMIDDVMGRGGSEPDESGMQDFAARDEERWAEGVSDDAADYEAGDEGGWE